MLVNHLKGGAGASKYLTVAYGLHIVSGHLCKSLVTGSSPNHQITIQQLLGRGPWDGCEGLWFNGLEITPANYKFYPGIQSPGMSDTTQGRDSVFDTDTPHSGVAWIRATLPTGVGNADTKNNPPNGLAGRFRTTKCQNYNASGSAVGSPAYSTNPALQVADLLLRIGRIPSSRIDWPAWVDWRDYCDELIDHDYTALPGLAGIGLRADYYNGTSFDTLVTSRIDPYVEFASSNGSPGIGVNADNFSARFRGKIKPLYTETYTFYLTHTHGARLWVNNLSTPLIDQWTSSGTHSATIALTADQLYDIKVEWQHTTGTAELRLEWQSTSQAREVVSHRRLYPLTVQKQRFETHPAFPSPTRLDDAVRTILSLCKSTVQERGGKLRFFSFEQITQTSFNFDSAVILDGSFRVTKRDVTQTRNVWTASYRDVESQYIERPIDILKIEDETLIAKAGRRIDGEPIELYNMTTHQAYRVLDAVKKMQADTATAVELSAAANSFEVLPGDAVHLELPILNTPRKMLVVEANDRSAEETPDERLFTLTDWTLHSISDSY
jgi:hypothetical protein